MVCKKPNLYWVRPNKSICLIARFKIRRDYTIRIHAWLHASFRRLKQFSPSSYRFNNSRNGIDTVCVYIYICIYTYYILILILRILRIRTHTHTFPLFLFTTGGVQLVKLDCFAEDFGALCRPSGCCLSLIEKDGVILPHFGCANRIPLNLFKGFEEEQNWD